MLWHKDPRKRAGGYWRCAVAIRERDRARYNDPVCRVSIRAQVNAYYEANRERIRATAAARYDNDPVYRISKRLRQDARQRQRRLERRHTGAAKSREGNSRPWPATGSKTKSTYAGTSSDEQQQPGSI